MPIVAKLNHIRHQHQIKIPPPKPKPLQVSQGFIIYNEHQQKRLHYNRLQYTEYELTGNLVIKVERDNVDREATNFRLLEVFLHFALNTSQFRGNLQKDETTKKQKR